MMGSGLSGAMSWAMQWRGGAVGEVEAREGYANEMEWVNEAMRHMEEAAETEGSRETNTGGEWSSAEWNGGSQWVAGDRGVELGGSVSGTALAEGSQLRQRSNASGGEVGDSGTEGRVGRAVGERSTVGRSGVGAEVSGVVMSWGAEGQLDRERRGLRGARMVAGAEGEEDGDAGWEGAVTRGAGSQGDGGSERDVLGMEGGAEGRERGCVEMEGKKVNLKVQLKEGTLLLKSLKSAYDVTHDDIHLDSRPVARAVAAGRGGGDNGDAEKIVPAGTRGTDP